MNSTAAEAGDTAAQAVKTVEFKFPHLLQLPALVPPQLKIDSKLKAGAQAFTYGWDTVFAIRKPDVNAAIVKAGSSPTSFSQVAPDNSCSVTGTFGPWQVCGGDGVDLHFQVPIVKGSLSYKNASYPMDGADATIEVQLEYIPPQPKPRSNQPKSKHNLVMRTTMPENEPVVSVVDLSLPGFPGFLQKSLMRALLEVWMNDNLASFSHVFSAVEINRIVDQKQFQWLAPTRTRYAFARGQTANSSVFGVLCMTQGRNDGGIASQLSPNAIPPGARSGFLISRERFLEEMVLPGLPNAFPGSLPSDFAMSPDKTEVINRANLKTKPVNHMGTTYHPEVTSLAISVVGDEIVVSSVTRTDIALGTCAEVSVTSYQRLKVANKPDGSQTLVYEESRPPIKDHTVKTSASGEKLKIILEIAAIVVGVILTILTDGAFLIVALIIIALLVGLVEGVPKLIADVVGNKVSNESPSLALLVSNSTNPIQWPGGADFRLTWAGMNDSLQLGGNPGFV